MDLQTQDPDTDEFSPDEPQPGLSRITIKRVLRNLAATLPVSAEENPEEFAEEWEAARELFWGLHPRNPVEAALAARAVACHYRNMDMCARAAKPGTSDENARRLTASALAASRSFDAALRTLGRSRKPASGPATRIQSTRADAPAETRKPEPQRPSAGPLPARPSAAAAQPEPAPGRLPRGPAPIPHIDLPQLRDNNGKPIPARSPADPVPG